MPGTFLDTGEMAVSDTQKSLLSWILPSVEETDNKQNFKIITDLMKLRWIENDLLLVVVIALARVRMFGFSFLPQFCRVHVQSWAG